MDESTTGNGNNVPETLGNNVSGLAALLPDLIV